jgi:nucleoside-diphosphate-sugar epimerase
MEHISRHADLLKSVNCVIHAAAAWGGEQKAWAVNYDATLKLYSLLNFAQCRQVIHLSTASALDFNRRLLPQALEFGTPYIRSKALCLQRLAEIEDGNFTVLCPTVLLGGGDGIPLSHPTKLLRKATTAKFVEAMRFFKADGTLHWIGAADAASLIAKWAFCPPDAGKNPIVLGNRAYSVDELIRRTVIFYGKKPRQHIPLTGRLAESMIRLFKIKLSPWDRYCMGQRHFTFDRVANPASEGLAMDYPDWESVLKSLPG